MEFGIIFANTGPYTEPEAAVALARAAEDVGIESLWTVEHTVVPKGYESEYPYSRTGRMPGSEQAPIPDPLVWLTWVGANTTRLKLGTGILILPQRNPVVLAKECATLDQLSGGRLLLGIGVGWLHEEFEALGVGWEDRAARTDDAVWAMRALWEQDCATYEGSHARFSDVFSNPKPANGTIPIVVGGHSKPAARRAGRLGDGFFPADPRHLPELLPVMRAAAEEAGRDPDAIEISTGGRPRVEDLEVLQGMGVSRFVMPPPPDPATAREHLETFATDVMARLA